MATSGLPPCVKLTGGKRGAPGPLIVTTSDEDSSDGEAFPVSPRAAPVHIPGTSHIRLSPRATNITQTSSVPSYSNSSYTNNTIDGHGPTHGSTYPSLKLDLSRALPSDINATTTARTCTETGYRQERSEVRAVPGAHTARAASPSPEPAGFSAHKQACEGYEHDHDYENVASPSGSSTASGPVYVRPPGFQHHAQEIRRKKKKSTGLLERREGLKSRAPTPPKVKPRREPLPMRLRALPQSFWKQPNNPTALSPGNMFSSLPPLSYAKDDDVTEMRPITPPEEREQKERKQQQKPTKVPERKVIVTGDPDLLLKHLFADVMDEKKVTSSSNATHLKRGRPPKKMMTLPTKTSTKGLISGDDPYLIDCSVTQKLFPQLSLESSTRQGHGGASSLQLITLREGDKSVTLPSLSIEQNYSQMLSELVMNI